MSIHEEGDFVELNKKERILFLELSKKYWDNHNPVLKRTFVNLKKKDTKKNFLEIFSYRNLGFVNHSQELSRWVFGFSFLFIQ